MTCEKTWYDFFQVSQNIWAAVIVTIATVLYNYAKYRHDKVVFGRDLLLKFNEKYHELERALDDLVDWEIETEQKAGMSPYEYKDLSTVLDEYFYGEPSSEPERFKCVFQYVFLASEVYYWYQNGQVDIKIWNVWNVTLLRWHDISEVFQRSIEKAREAKVPFYQEDFLNVFPKHEFKDPFVNTGEFIGD